MKNNKNKLTILFMIVFIALYIVCYHTITKEAIVAEILIGAFSYLSFGISDEELKSISLND